MNSRLLIILGPTSTGKTDVALDLAKKFNGELVSCDSRQVYKGLDIGTGKLPGLEVKVEKHDNYWILDNIKVWMYDVVDFKKQYTVFDYVNQAKKIIEDIESRNKLPIIVGGSGLYLKGLLFGFDNLNIPIDEKLRKELEKLSLEQMQYKLKTLALGKWRALNNSDKQNPRRLVRAIELTILSAKEIRKTDNGLGDLFNTLKIGLTATKENLFIRSDKRVVLRMQAGMIGEAEKLHKKGLTFSRMKQLGLEYGLLSEYLQNQIKEEQELIEKIQIKIHQYIKRQLVWFKKEEQVVWFDIAQSNYLKGLEKEVDRWYHQADGAKN